MLFSHNERVLRGAGSLCTNPAGNTQIRYLQGHMSGWYKAELPVEISPQ
jgi:hypothetical protein